MADSTVASAGDGLLGSGHHCMDVFSDIDDELIWERSRDFKSTFQSARELAGLLKVDSYAEMGGGEAAADLVEKARILAGELRHPLAETLPEALDREVLARFLTAYRLEELYPDTVGEVEEIVSSIPLVTLPMFRVRRLDPDVRSRTAKALAEAWKLTAAQSEKIEEAVKVARERLTWRRRLVDEVRLLLAGPNGGLKDRAEIKAVFDQYFPGNPLFPSEIDVVVARTCLYWCLPKAEEIEQRATEGETSAVTEWLAYTGRFAFQYFNHFPTFSSFDARDADTHLSALIADRLGESQTDIMFGLNGTTTIERTADIEKYLIHDTWGHMWQGDLTDLGRLYDTMESLKCPVEAGDHVVLPDGNVVTMLDLCYLTGHRAIRYDIHLANRYVNAWLRRRLDALLAPIVAELTADCVEYKFRLHREQGDLLPSSSMFAHEAAKLDFAWVDLGYFVRSLRRTNAAYLKDEALMESLVSRVALLLSHRYPRQYSRGQEEHNLLGEIGLHLEIFFEQLESKLKRELNLDETKSAEESPQEPNAILLLFTNLLRIQATLNHLIGEVMGESEPELAELFDVLVIFIARQYESDPTQRFWDLDEVLGTYGLSVLREISATERQVQNRLD